VRCKRLEKECIDSEGDSDSSEYDNELHFLQQQVEELYSLIREMENELNSLTICGSDSSEYDHDGDDNRQMIISSSIDNTYNSINNSNKLWRVMFHNGTLRIETNIRSVSDLLMQCSPSRNLMVRFDSGKTIRFVPLSIKLLAKCIAPTSTSIPLLLPTVFELNFIVDELVTIYFHCRNTYKPLIHERTFLEYYHKLRSPLDSLVALSICCVVCATPCNHIAHDSYRFRQLGDHFYSLAKPKLTNQFDETNKRLENLISINLLSEFIIATLKLEDFKNFVTIGYRICLDLETWFESTKDQGNTVERMLFSRHFSSTFTNQGLLSLITNEPKHYLSIHYPEWILADDDAQETACYVEIQNYLVKLQNSPYLNNIKVSYHLSDWGGVIFIVLIFVFEYMYRFKYIIN
jgi:chaperonin cofactor prefoldin